MAEFAPPPHSIAVLPFVNMSGDPKQDYFSDGLSEELLNSLVAVRDLQVAARTSSFMFKGRNETSPISPAKLNVGAVLEGSVRKDGSQVGSPPSSSTPRPDFTCGRRPTTGT